MASICTRILTLARSRARVGPLAEDVSGMHHSVPHVGVKNRPYTDMKVPDMDAEPRECYELGDSGCDVTLLVWSGLVN